MSSKFVSGLCVALLACSSVTAQVITIYQVQSHPLVNQLTVEQINSLGLNCNNKDYLITTLENRVGNQPINPEQLAQEHRRLNAAARSKIWQLRTYCP